MYATDNEDKHICFAEANFHGERQGTNSEDGTGQFFEGRATQVPYPNPW
jgi:hypothetical protein